MRIQLAIPLTVGDVVDAVSASPSSSLFDAKTTVSAVTTDSREAQEGDLFIAVKGERFDGNQFLPDVFKKGAIALGSGPLPTGVSGLLLRVSDATRALGSLAAFYAKKIPHKTVAITGSIGKTTTKETVAAVLSSKFRVHATKGNLNNQLGLPLTLLSMPIDTEILVLEMGMSDRGEIAYLSRLARPDVGIVTNVGSSHLERLGTRENIGRAKMEITEGMKQGSRLFLQGDDDVLLTYAAHPLSPHFISLRTKENAAAYADGLRIHADRTIFNARIGKKNFPDCLLPIPGQHAVSAALFALSVGEYLGMQEEELRKGLAGCNQDVMHQRIVIKNGVTVIDDCYNAAPESMRAALALLALQKKNRGGRSLALLGDMKELGKNAERMHFDVGVAAAESGLDFLVTYGVAASAIAEGALYAGMAPEKIAVCPDASPMAAAEKLREHLTSGDLLLVKASRAMRAEEILKLLFP